MFKNKFKILIIGLSIFTCVGCSDGLVEKNDLEHHNGCTCDECLDNTYNDLLKEYNNVEYRKPAQTGEELDKYLVHNNRSDYVIVIPQNHEATHEYAANELAKYIGQASGIYIAVKTDEEVPYEANKAVISIGDTVYKQNLVRDVDYSKLKTGGFYIKNFGNTFVIDSNCSEGRLYGVYEFLNAFFDVEFLTYDYTYFTIKDSVKAKAIDYLTIPAFDIRDYYYYAIWYQGVSWGAKLRSNSSSYKCSDSVTGPYQYDYYGFYYNNPTTGAETFPAREGHTIQDLLRVDAYRRGFIPDPNYKTTEGGANDTLPVGYATTVPEWYAYNPTFNRGMTRDHRSEEEVCYTNGLDDNFEYIPQLDLYDTDNDNKDLEREKSKSLVTKMIEICVKMIKEEKSTKAINLMLGQADYDCMCMCDKCVKLRKYCENPEYPGSGFGGSLGVWANQINRGVRAELARQGVERDFKIVIFAYSKGIIPPVKRNANGKYVPLNDKVVLDRDIIIKMAYRQCVYHPVWDMSCEYNQRNRNIFDGWSKLVTGDKPFVIWDYTCDFSNYLFYMPNFGSIPSNYRYYQEIGVTHLLSQGTPSEYNYYESNLHCWTSCKLMWDPSLNVTALNKYFNKLYFGEKYGPIVDQYRAWMDSYYSRADALTPATETTPAGHHVATDSTYSWGMEKKESYDLNHLLKACDILQNALTMIQNDNDLNYDEKELMDSKIRSALITPQFMILWMFKNDLESNQVKEMATDFFKSIDILKITYMREGNSEQNTFEAWKGTFDL